MTQCNSCADCRSCADRWPEYRATELMDFAPLRHVTPLSLSAGQVIPVSSFSLVKREVLVSVRTGVVHLWFADAAGRPQIDGDEPHLIIGIDNHPFKFVLAPGAHKMIFGAGGGAALNATVVVHDVESRG